MMNLFFRCRISYELSVSRGQVAMAEPDDAVAVERAAPDRAVFGPTFRIHEKAFDESLGHPCVMREQRKVYVDQRVGSRESLPGRRDAPEAIDNPSIARK